MGPIQRTIYAASLQAHNLLGKAYIPQANTTLNEAYDILASSRTNTTVQPFLKYLSIGNGGALYSLTSNNSIVIQPIDKAPKCVNLYHPIPFIVRAIETDGSGDILAGGTPNRDNYRMRKIVTIGIQKYACYYLKVLNTSDPVAVKLKTVQNGLATRVAFVPDSGNLTQSPPTSGLFDLSNPNGTYLETNGIATLTLTEDDIAEIVSACTILYGNSNYAIINEIALCTGIDAPLSTGLNSLTTYTESIKTQVASFINRYYVLNSYNTSLPLVFDVGAVEPLLT